MKTLTLKHIKRALSELLPTNTCMNDWMNNRNPSYKFSVSSTSCVNTVCCILSVAVMSQIRILTPDWSIAAVPCYSPEWKITFGVNDEANKIRVCSKITSWNNFFLQYVINNDILQLCLQKISLDIISKQFNMTNLSAVHRHSMISFTPVTQSVCAKFNNCDRQNICVLIILYSNAPCISLHYSDLPSYSISET